MTTELNIERSELDSGVVIIDRSRLFREGMKRLFDATGFRIVAEARSLDDVLPDLRQPAPEPRVLLVEWFEADEEFMEKIAELHAMEGTYRIIALNHRVDSSSLITALRAGAQAFLLKDLSPDALVESLRLVELGEIVFPTELAAMLVTNGASRWHFDTPKKGTVAEMTAREMQILRCLACGNSNKVIANRLKVAESTIKTQIKGLLRKIDASNRTQAAIWALSQGLGPTILDDHALFDDHTASPSRTGTQSGVSRRPSGAPGFADPNRSCKQAIKEI
ncbi:response regulator transcription factor [Fodinicurvata sp. EGI_FJ10296]|uniref:response regulator transcription factor n=1 Tax=Fodinicurvata sp. EGI_FJ10296 TaxID=3231908 RepID=UPI003456C497